MKPLSKQHNSKYLQLVDDGFHHLVHLDRAKLCEEAVLLADELLEWDYLPLLAIVVVNLGREFVQAAKQQNNKNVQFVNRNS